MAGHGLVESEPQQSQGGVPDEVIRLVKLVRRLEHENATLRKELAARALAA